MMHEVFSDAVHDMCYLEVSKVESAFACPGEGIVDFRRKARHSLSEGADARSDVLNVLKLLLVGACRLLRGRKGLVHGLEIFVQLGFFLGSRFGELFDQSLSLLIQHLEALFLLAEFSGIVSQCAFLELVLKSWTRS